MEKYNTQAKVIAGLQNDYNTFSLRKNKASSSDQDAYSSIKIDIIIDGDIYVENSSSQILQAGESTLKDFEGINPVLKNRDGKFTWEDKKYGQHFLRLFKDYLNIENSGSQNSDIYNNPTSYLNYRNQFKIEFKDDNSEITPLKSDDREYLNYNNEITSYVSHKVINKSLGDICGENNKYLYFNTTIIHFSKYYNIYDIDDNINTPILVPLLYEESDLDKYGLTLVDDSLSRSIPRIKSLYAFRISNDGDKLQVYKGTFSSGSYLGLTNEDNSSGYLSISKVSSGELGVSQFSSNHKQYPTIKSIAPDFWKKQPKGFVLFGMYDNEYWFNSDDTKIDQSDRFLPTNISAYYSFGENYSFQYRGLEVSARPFVGIGYNGDGEGGLRLFNTYFKVKRSTELGNSDITDAIDYRISSDGYYPNKPEYIGQVVASLLTSIYTYREVSLSQPYISDIKYLSDNYTTYTQDIVYNAKFVNQSNSSNGSNNFNAENSILLIHQSKYDEYLTKLLQNAGMLSNTGILLNAEKINLNNVNVNFKQCIKNIPIQFKLNYIQPDIMMTGSDQIIVKHIDGTQELLTGITPTKDDLYYIDDNKKEIKIMDKDFSIKYIDKLTAINGVLKGTRSKVKNENNPYIYNMFKAVNGELSFITNQLMSVTVPAYSIVEDDQEGAIHNLLKSDVIAPYSKVM